MNITPKLLSRRTALLLPLLATPARAQEKTLKVVTSFTILADMVHQVGETRVAVRSLAGPNQDLHGFEPRPSDLQAVAQADVMVVNGLGLEGWAERIAKAAGFKGTAIVASKGVAALKAGHKPGAGHSHAGHNHGAHDPHAWQDIANARRYVENIRAGLAAADPSRAAAHTAAAARYTAELTALDAEIRALFAAIPRALRRAVTSHDAFAYFAAAYGMDMLAIAGTWKDSEPSARDLAALTAQVKRQNIRALFLENASNPAALNALSSETGIRIGGELYPDALTPPGGPADTYLKMMRHNATTIVAALK
ncbi:MAG: zinc ABC transporter substrate-binding protein [Alphaproteobacteria bacterium]|nr:zinc ABC transporter substrate-binding protein [Alphaproteobacteria bacterium]